MIDVTRMNGSLLTVNNHLIVKESRQEVKNLVKLYEKEITCNS